MTVFERIRGASRFDIALVAARVVAAVALVVYAVRHAAPIPHDTNEYLAHTITRPPLYPLFLDLTRALFGARFLRPTAGLQALLGCAAAWHAGRILGDRFTLGRSTIVVQLLLLAPQVGLAPIAGSDSLTYVLFLLTFGSAVEALYEPTTARLIRPWIWAMLAILTRAQMLFVLPVLAGTLVFAWRRTGTRNAARVLAVAVAIVIGGTLLHKTYNYVFNHSFVTVPYTGIQLLTMNVYLMTDGDLDRFAEADRPYIDRVYRRATNERLRFADKPFGDPTTHHLYGQYNELCHDTIVGTWAEQFTTHRFSRELQSRSLSPDELVALDHYTLHLAFVLLRHDWPRYVALIARCWNQYEGMYGLFVIVAAAIAAAVALRTDDRMWLVILLAAALWAANNLLVCMVEVILWRYACYTDMVTFTTLVAALLRFARERCAE